jgi:hypothetical protein
VEPAPSGQDAAKARFVKLTPLSSYWDESVAGSPGEGNFTGAYTRFVIESDVYANQQPSDAAKPDDEQVLPYKSRNWLRRALIGREFSINLAANMAVGSFEQTVPLVTIGYSSNSSGEKWTRVIHHGTSGFPLFLVKGDGSASMPRIQFSVKAENSYSSRGAAAALGVALQLAKSISVAPTVMTKLTSESARSEAKAIDNAISQLFGSSLTEEHWSDRDLSNWVNDPSHAHGAVIEFSIPEDDTDFGSQPIKVGWWRITFDDPRPSIFVDWRVCASTKPRCKATLQRARNQVVADISASEVLNYKLVPANSELSTVRAYLASQDWYGTASTAFVAQQGDALQASASVFCRRLLNEVTGLGLNSFDAAAVLWAVYRGMPMAFPDLSRVPSCAEGMQEFASKR